MSKQKFDKMVNDDVAMVQLQENLERARKINEEKDKELAAFKKSNDAWKAYQDNMFDSLVQERLDLLGRVWRLEQRIHAVGMEVPPVPKLTTYNNQTSPALKLAAAFDEAVNQWKIQKDE